MSFYIIARATGLIVSDGPDRTRAYKTFGSACATRTRVCRKRGWSLDELDVVNTETYKPRQVTRKNLMTGQLYQEDVNTSRVCSPASESYWSA